MGTLITRYHDISYYCGDAILTMFQVWRGALWWVQSASPAPMFRVVVYKHVIRHSQNMTIHADRRRDHHLQEDQTYLCLLISSTNPHLAPLPHIFIGQWKLLRLCMASWKQRSFYLNLSTADSRGLFSRDMMLDKTC